MLRNFSKRVSHEVSFSMYSTSNGSGVLEPTSSSRRLFWLLPQDDLTSSTQVSIVFISLVELDSV